MLKKNTMKAYTNYPLQTNPTSSVVEIEVLSYDRNKYAGVRHDGEEEEIKTGYIYKDAELTKRFAEIEWYLLPEDAWSKKPTRQQAYQEMKYDKRRKGIKYALNLGGSLKEYKNLSDALSAFASSSQDGWLLRSVRKGYSFNAGPILERVDGWLYVVLRRGRFCLKTNHIKKYKIEYYKETK